MTLNSTPALDFTRRVATWQDADGASAGLPMLIPDRAQGQLSRLLADLDRLGPSSALEERARGWLIGYQELEAQQQTLTPARRAELDAIVSRLRDPEPAPRTISVITRRPRPRISRLAIIVLALGAVLCTLALVLNAIGLDHDPAPQGGTSQQQAPAPPAAGLTDLQRLKADWNVPAAASASAGNARAVVYLDGGLYYPVPWAVPAADAGWSADQSGAVTAGVPVKGSPVIQVMDGNGTTWDVTIGQPFLISSDPQSVFRVTAGADIESMPLAHAIAIRHRV